MIYVLNGGAFEKVAAFAKKEDYYLLDNKGDNYNKENIAWLEDNLTIKDKVLVTSEFQMVELYTNHRDWYEDHKDQIICTKSNKFNLYELCSKAVLTALPPENQVPEGILDLSDDNKIEEFELSSDNYIFKRFIDSGSNGIVTKDKYAIFSGCPKGNKLKDYLRSTFKDTKEVLWQKVCEFRKKYQYYSVPTVIKNGEVVDFVTLLGHDRNTSEPKLNYIYLSKSPEDDIIKVELQKIVDALGIYEGFFEIELIKVPKDDNLNTNKVADEYKVLDLNPRWSFDHSTIINIMWDSFYIEYSQIANYMKPKIATKFQKEFEGKVFKKFYHLGEVYVCLDKANINEK